MRLFLVCLIALTAAGCASAKMSAPGTAPTRATSTSPSTPSSTPGSMPPGTTPIRLFANPVALSFSAEPGVVLRGRTDVMRFVHWLRTRPRPADADAPVADALARGVSQAPTLVAIAQNYGCASMKGVSLGSRGTNLVLVPSGLQTHPECLRANLVVAVFALSAPLPYAVTLNGQQPNTAWR
ncbi:MAG TPA: hypothetical protein VH373_08995 [Jatrophihabitantaceae bacterium]